MCKEIKKTYVSNYKEKLLDDDMVEISCEIDMPKEKHDYIQSLCEDYNTTLSDILRDFVYWVAECPEEAKEWLQSEAPEYITVR